MGVFRRFWYSLIGVRHYPALTAAGPRQAMSYLFLLVAVISIIFAVRDFGRVGEALDVTSEAIASWPDFTLVDGRLEFKGTMPFITVAQDHTYIIDTTGGTGLEIFAQHPKGFLLTATHLYYKTPARPAIPLSWAEFPITTSRDKLARSIPHMFWPIYALVVLCLVFGNLARKAVAVAVLGLAGWLAIGARDPTYGRACAASVYALTVPTILALGKNILLPNLQYFAWLYWGLALAWSVLAVIRIKRSAAAADIPLYGDEPAAAKDDGEFDLL